jgi:TolB-like protein/tetratricopeptide (TPR) repeat protein
VGQDNPNNPASITEDDADLVEHQLALILVSPHFKSAKQMQHFLQYVVRKSLSGKAKNLKQYTIAVEALGFPTDFDSDTNPVVRIQAGRVRERLSKYYENEGENDALVISMPKGSYEPTFEKKARTQKPSIESDGHSVPPKLAVLCYSDETQDNESNRLLFQVTDTMAMELSHFLFTKLVVSIPHADKKMARNASIDIHERYQADYMLVFYIQQLPKNHHKLLVRLMDVSDEAVLWSESYELKDSEPFDEQHDIIGNITAVISDIQQGILQHHWARRLLENEESIPDYHKVQAYYRYYNDDLGLATFTKAVDVCKVFLEAHPNDILSLMIYADYCRRDYVYGYNVIEDPLVIGKELAEKAARLQPNSHEAHYVLAQILFCLDEPQECLSELNLSRDIYQYNAVVLYGVGFHICLLGYWGEGMETVEKAMSVSSTYPSWFNIAPFLNAYRNEEYEEALSYALKIHTPHIFHAPMARCVCFAQLGDSEKAKKELEELVKRYPTFMEKGKEVLSRYLVSEEVVDKLWKGIKKAAALT